MTTLAEWLRAAKSEFENQQFSLDLELIICDILGFHDRSELVLNGEKELSEKQIELANNFKLRRARAEPLPYILGYKDFFQRRFKVNSNVLIPRPETEEIISILKELANQNTIVNSNEKITLCDIGTGSGCIAISAFLELKPVFGLQKLQVFASDSSSQALEIAQENARKYNAQINFLESDLMTSYPSGILEPGKIDFLVANLPYVDKSWDWLDLNVLSFEPKQALFAEKDGLELIFKLIEQADKFRPRFLILEADTCQIDSIVDFAEKHKFSLKKRGDFILVFARN